jgi:hypothetical protein
MYWHLVGTAVTCVFSIATTMPTTAPADRSLSDDEISAAITAASVRKDIGSMERLYSRLNSTLKQTDPRRYVSACTKLSKALTTFDFHNPARLASSVALSGLESADANTEILERIELAVRLRSPALSSKSDDQEARHHYMDVWTDVMQRVETLAVQPIPEREIPPFFDPDMPISGGDPRTIKDPERRAHYEKEQRRLREAAAFRHEVTMAHKRLRDAASAYVTFVNAAYAEVPDETKRAELERYLAASLLPDADRARIKFPPPK